MKKYWKKIVIVAVLIGGFAAVRQLGLQNILTFENLKSNKDALQTFVQENNWQSVLIYILIYLGSVAFSVPGAIILTLTGGFVFGALLGAVYVNIGATSGAVAVFLFARYLIGARLQEKYADKLASFNKEVDANGYSYLLTLRFIPLFPFWMINLFAGLTNIPLRTYLWTTAVGIFPGSLVYTYMGRQLNTIESLGDLFSIKIFLAFIFLGLFALTPTIIKHVKKISRARASEAPGR
jgi:uncharacterized membrane protein YdjX (TVP38/TMEM64 family)